MKTDIWEFIICPLMLTALIICIFFFLWSDSVESRMQKLLSRISSTIIANITIKAFDDLDEVEVCFELISLGYC